MMGDSSRPIWHKYALEDFVKWSQRLTASVEEDTNSTAEHRARCLWLLACIEYLTQDPENRMRASMISLLIKAWIDHVAGPRSPARLGLIGLIARLEEARDEIKHAPRRYKTAPAGETRHARLSTDPITEEAVPGLEKAIGYCKEVKEAVENRAQEQQNPHELIAPLLEAHQDIDNLRWAKTDDERKVLLAQLVKDTERLKDALGVSAKTAPAVKDQFAVHSIGRRVAKWYGIDKRSWDKRANANFFW